VVLLWRWKPRNMRIGPCLCLLHCYVEEVNSSNREYRQKSGRGSPDIGPGSFFLPSTPLLLLWFGNSAFFVCMSCFYITHFYHIYVTFLPNKFELGLCHLQQNFLFNRNQGRILCGFNLVNYWGLTICLLFSYIGAPKLMTGSCPKKSIITSEHHSLA
jgi:hypothetical protein